MAEPVLVPSSAPKPLTAMEISAELTDLIETLAEASEAVVDASNSGQLRERESYMLSAIGSIRRAQLDLADLQIRVEASEPESEVSNG